MELERELAEAEEQIAIQGFRKAPRTESSTAPSTTTSEMVDAADKYYRETLGHCIHGRDDFAGIYEVMLNAAPFQPCENCDSPSRCGTGNRCRRFASSSTSAMKPGLRKDVVKRLRDLHLITCAADKKDSRHNETLASLAADIIEADAAQSATASASDTARLDWLDSQRKGWADGFCTMSLDDGSKYVRPWRYANEKLQGFESIKCYTDVRYAIDAAMREQSDIQGQGNG
jgi:hypothetical protein